MLKELEGSLPLKKISSILSRMNPVHIVFFPFLSHLDLLFQVVVFLQGFRPKPCMHFASVSRVPSRPPRSNHSNNIGRRVQIMNLLIRHLADGIEENHE
jgi:hypothetical protein